MGFKKHNWVNYGRQGEIIEITIRDASMGKIDSFRCNNKKDYRKILRVINSKYGYSPSIDIENSPNFDKEKDWLMS